MTLEPSWTVCVCSHVSRQLVNYWSAILWSYWKDFTHPEDGGGTVLHNSEHLTTTRCKKGKWFGLYTLSFPTLLL
jgi:hypothetical protein